MDERTNNSESLIARIQQVEHERDELRKDIEQLCIQQAGPSYLVVATRMHFQRTAGLEQEIENLKKKLAGCTRDNLNLQEELSEVYHIKSQLADLHSAEVSKNKEAEKQVKFFQSCMAAAFSERDHSLMETEKANEREEAMSCRLKEFQKRVEELTADCLVEKKLNIALNNELMKLKDQNANFEKVIDKFFKIRQDAVGCTEDSSEDKPSCLLHDPDEMWSFEVHREASTSICSVSIEELEILKNSLVTLQNQLRMGLECEELLRNKVCTLEEKRILSEERVRNGLSMLHHFHTQHRHEVMGLLEEENIQIRSMFNEAKKKIQELEVCEVTSYGAPQRDEKCDNLECRDVHITNDVDPCEAAEGNGFASSGIGNVGVDDTSSAFTQALQEKVAALLLLSQQEERHLLEKNVYAALEKKMEEHQKNLVQVTNEKVKVLMELAQLKQEYQLLQESISDGTKQGNFLSSIGEKIISAQESDGKIKNLLKRTYLKSWIGRLDHRESQASLKPKNDERSSTNKNPNYAVDFARLKVENATLQESMASMEHLTSTIHKLRLSLLKARDSATSSDADYKVLKAAVGDIIFEANLVKTALSSSLPLSWSAEEDPASGNSNLDELAERSGDSGSEKLDYVSAAGFELVELLIMAANLQKDKLIEKYSSTGS